ncbi:MAG TPA: metallophosphoesterase [Streptosporangiaceae bacterium]|nr:metallophosphoesterase [Streptosporangiaceae bacterium]
MTGHSGAGEPQIVRGEHGMTRRQLIRHTAWFGAAVALTFTGGEVISRIAGNDTADAATDPGALRFVQISDSHLGFTGTANPDVAATFGTAINQVNALGYEPDFVMHTGDVTHLSLPSEFAQAKEMMSDIRTPRVFTVPGEHDTINDGGREYRKFFGAQTLGDGWFSFDIKGVHVISLVNTTSVDALGRLGAGQLDFVRRDVARLSAETPIVVFSHIPLYAMYPKWGWGTGDAITLLGMLRRFGSVTCLNGHVHQVFTKTEGNVTFHSSAPTCYPLPEPGQAPAPLPVTLPAGELTAALGIRTVSFRAGSRSLALTDERLG